LLPFFQKNQLGSVWDLPAEIMGIAFFRLEKMEKSELENLSHFNVSGSSAMS